MVKIKAQVIVQIYPIIDDVAVSFNDGVLVSLDCDFCQRTGRSVYFSTTGGANCNPGSARRRHQVGVVHPPYPGKVVGIKVENKNNQNKKERVVRATYTLEYETNEFVDRDHKYRKWTGHPTWGRVSFSVTCPKCKTTDGISVQNNSVQSEPYSYHNCKSCKTMLWKQSREEMPIFRWRFITNTTGDDKELVGNDRSSRFTSWNIVPSYFCKDSTAIRDEIKDHDKTKENIMSILCFAARDGEDNGNVFGTLDRGLLYEVFSFLIEFNEDDF